MDWVPLNFAILKNPVNWLTVLLMVMIGMFAYHAVISSLGSFGFLPQPESDGT